MIGSDSFIRTFLRPSQDIIPLSFLHPFNHGNTGNHGNHGNLNYDNVHAFNTQPDNDPSAGRLGLSELSEHSDVPSLEVAIRHNSSESGNHGTALCNQGDDSSESGNHGNHSNEQLVDLIVRSSIEIESKSQSELLDSNHGNHGNLLEVCNVNKSVSIESDTVFSHEEVLTFSRGMFDLMYRTVYPELSLSGLEGHVFIVHGNHGNHSVYTRVSRVGSYDFITSVLSISINRNIASLEDGVNGLCIVNNLYGESVNENVVRSVLGCVEGYSFGYVMFYNVLSGNLGGEASVECFDLKGRAMVFDLSNANERTLFEQ